MPLADRLETLPTDDSASGSCETLIVFQHKPEIQKSRFVCKSVKSGGFSCSPGQLQVDSVAEDTFLIIFPLPTQCWDCREVPPATSGLYRYEDQTYAFVLLDKHSTNQATIRFFFLS